MDHAECKMQGGQRQVQTGERTAGWRRIPLAVRILILIPVIPVGLVVLLWLEENWRGDWALRRCEREFQARGISLNWRDYHPQPVPDAQNFARTPVVESVVYRRSKDSEPMQAFQAAAHQLVWPAWGNAARGRRLDWGAFPSIGEGTPEAQTRQTAQAFLDSTDAVRSFIAALRESSRLPASQFEFRTNGAFADEPLVNFVGVRTVSQVLAFRACAEVALNQSTNAADDLRVIQRLADGLRAQGTLVNTMIRVAVLGLEAQGFWEGWAAGEWTDAQLEGFQSRFSEINLLGELDHTLRAELAGIHTLVLSQDTGTLTAGLLPSPPTSLPAPWQNLWQELAKHLGKLIPRGWVKQNLVYYDRLMDSLILPDLHARPACLRPPQVDALKPPATSGPFRRLAAIAVPNCGRAMRTTAYNQTLLHQAAVVCALERYHRVEGQYPETLAALSPRFLNPIPVDPIGGGPLHYRRADGRFELYSVGWNGADDGGLVPLGRDNENLSSADSGDWCWVFPTSVDTPPTRKTKKR